MRRIITFFLAASLVLGAYTAQAAEIKLSGWMAFQYEWGNASFERRVHANGNNEINDGGMAGQFFQRSRYKVDIAASENLSGTVQLEIGETQWGEARGSAGRGSGGAFGTDGVSVEVKHMYVDWMVPESDIRLRMGLQYGGAPSLTGLGGMVIDDDAAGIVISNQANPNVGFTAFWFRPSFNNAYNIHGERGQDPYGKKMHSNMDLFGLALPLTNESINMTVVPYGIYGTVGRDSLDFGASPQGSAAIAGMLPVWIDNDMVRDLGKKRGEAWWVGMSGEITPDPLRFAFDFVYGKYYGGTFKVDDTYLADGSGDSWKIESRGWTASAVAELKLDGVTPGVVGWYGTGDRKRPNSGSGNMPAIGPAFSPTSFGFADQPINSGFQSTVGNSANGTWGIMLRLADMNVVKDLKHTARVAYYRGTNHRHMGDPDHLNLAGHPSNFFENGRRPLGKEYVNRMYMTTRDHAWEANFDTFYDLYKNLQLGVEFGYINYYLGRNWDQDVRDDHKREAYKVAVGMKYSF
jgi:hypothetical protein